MTLIDTTLTDAHYSHMWLRPGAITCIRHLLTWLMHKRCVASCRMLPGHTRPRCEIAAIGIHSRDH